MVFHSCASLVELLCLLLRLVGAAKLQLRVQIQQTLVRFGQSLPQSTSLMTELKSEVYYRVCISGVYECSMCDGDCFGVGWLLIIAIVL